MQDGQIKVFVAFVGGVVMALPEFATRMIHLLGAQPAEEIMVREPEVTVRRGRHVTSLVAGGTSLKGGRRRTDELDGLERQPKRSWKRYRTTRYRVAA